MAINVDTITALSQEVIRQQGRALDVVTVTTTGGDSQRVEIPRDRYRLSQRSVSLHFERQSRRQPGIRSRVPHR
jgi:hypothetical protein